MSFMNALRYVLINFSAPIVFFWVFQSHGAKPAIALALLATALQLLYHRLKRLRPSPFFIVAAGFTLLFGSVDLLLARPRFFRLEPFAQNALIASVFLVSLLFRLPLAEWFVTGLPERMKPDLGADTHAYLRRLTLVWALYLYLKGFLFLWLAFRVDLGKLVVLRSVIGGATLVLMFVGEWWYREKLRPKGA